MKNYFREVSGDLIVLAKHILYTLIFLYKSKLGTMSSSSSATAAGGAGAGAAAGAVEPTLVLPIPEPVDEDDEFEEFREESECFRVIHAGFWPSADVIRSC